MANLAPSWRPKTLPNRGQNLKKSMLKIDTFSASIFEGFGLRFGRVFGWFLEGKMHENRTNTLFAKTWKTLIFHRENWYFQGFEVWKYQKFWQQWHEKLSLFWNINFGWILEGFWEDFGGQKPWFSHFFRCCFDVKIGRCFEKAKKPEKDRPSHKRYPSWAGPAECAGCWGEKKRGVQKLAGTEFWKKIFSMQTF